jgi:hypothetical protein
MNCSYCDEPLTLGEESGPVPGVHRECAIRMVIGSVAHQEKRCSCYCSESDEGDPPGVTTREAARLAAAAFQQRSISSGLLIANSSQRIGRTVANEPVRNYSQGNEQRAILAAVAHIEHGRFLDIGAAHPTDMSNTRALFEAGWSGVLIEPSPYGMAALIAEYADWPNITLVSAAVGTEDIFATLHVTPDMVSTIDAESREKWATAGWLGKVQVRLITLEQITCAFGHFDVVSIDAEGVSAELCRRMLEAGWEPRVFCVEADGRTHELAMVATGRGYVVTYASAENVVFVRGK